MDWGDCRPRNVDIEFFSPLKLTMPIFQQMSLCSWMIVPEVYYDTLATTTPGSFAAEAKIGLRLLMHGSLRTYTKYTTYKTKNVINPRRAYAVRVTVLDLSVCLSVCVDAYSRITGYLAT